MCYTIIVFDFCAPSDWDSWDDPGSPQICCIAHVVKFVRMVVGLLCPLPFLSHVNIGMNSDFPVGLMFPSNGRSKCMERLEAPIGCSRRFCIVADCKGGIERNTLRKATYCFWIDINNPTDFVVGKTEFSLHVWSDCSRPIPVPVCKLPVRPQGITIIQDLSRSGQRTHAINGSQPSSAVVSAAVIPTGAFLPCGIRTNHDNFTKETDIIFIFNGCQKVSLLQRFFRFNASH